MSSHCLTSQKILKELVAKNPVVIEKNTQAHKAALKLEHQFLCGLKELDNETISVQLLTGTVDY